MHCNFMSISYALVYQIKQEQIRKGQNRSKDEESTSAQKKVRDGTCDQIQVKQAIGKKDPLKSEIFPSELSHQFHNILQSWGFVLVLHLDQYKI